MQKSFTRLWAYLSCLELSLWKKGIWISMLFFVCALQSIAQTNTISGTVTDEASGESLPGVNVLVKGKEGAGTITDLQGNYRIGDVGPDDVLVFSFIGYLTQEKVVGNRTTVDVALKQDTKQLEEVVVVGYGTQTKGTITGAIGQVDGEALKITPSVTTSEALVGRIQGVTARQPDARPGSSANIQIRNMGDPLYVIDGVPADAAQFNNLGQNDIESISILKDASAAIYGLRAANGVILVTTKRGKMGKPSINISGYYGLQNFTRFPKPANAYQHVRANIESDQNRGIPTSYTPEELENWRVGAPGYESFDYYDMVMDPNVPQYQLNASASGGAENVKYYFSVTHLNQDAIIKDYNFNRTNFQSNIDVTLAEGLSIGTQISGRLEDRHNVGVPGYDDYFFPFLSVFTMWPTERPYANDNPDYINQTHAVALNPATYTDDITGYVDEVQRAIKGNFYAEYEFNFGLKARGTYSYNFTNLDFDGFEYTYDAYRYDEDTDTYYTQPGWGNQNPWRERRKGNYIDRFSQVQLSYEKKFGDHHISAVSAYERQDHNSHYWRLHTVPPNNYIPIMSFADQDMLEDRIGVEARAGYIARMNYNYKEKYLLEVMGRYDGSFLFPPSSRWGFFPGASAGWKISEEPFFRENIGNVLSEFKFRGSYGRLGSDRMNGNWIVAPFNYLEGYNFITSPGGSSVMGDNFVQGVRPRGLPVTTLSWLTNITTNVGIDFGLFENKLTGSFDVFQRERRGIPVANQEVLIPREAGYELPQENLNSDAHRGLEGMLSYTGKAGNLNYTVSANATVARRWDIHYEQNRRFGNSWHEYRNSWQDRWANINWGYQVVGRFQSQEEIDNHQINNDARGNRTMLPGDFIYKDVNGDGVINGMDERPIGYAQGANPYMSFGLNGSFSYKGFSLMYNLAGASLQTYTRSWELRYPFQNNGTSPEYMFEDRWHRQDPFGSLNDEENPWVEGTYPAIRRDAHGHANYSRHSDWWLTNVRYFRLRNLEIGYEIPTGLLERIKVKGLRVYANGTNLFTFDNVKDYGIDPEIGWSNGLVYPQQKLYNFGFNLTF
jgi:TonB-linked SusC/RagA family outer membrane protein